MPARAIRMPDKGLSTWRISTYACFREPFRLTSVFSGGDSRVSQSITDVTMARHNTR